MKICDTVFELTRAKVEELGYELVEVQYQNEQGNMVLTLYIDSESGITLDDCEKVSSAVDPILDEADPIKDAYYLSVSSLGIDRPLKTERDFRKNLGKPVTAKLYAAVGGKKEFTGILTDYTDTDYTLKVKTKDAVLSMTILKKDTAIIRPYIEF